MCLWYRYGPLGDARVLCAGNGTGSLVVPGIHIHPTNHRPVSMLGTCPKGIEGNAKKIFSVFLCVHTFYA